MHRPPAGEPTRSLHHYLDAVALVRAAEALRDVGALAALARSPATVDGLADALELEARPLAVALDVLATAHLAGSGQDGRWSVDPAVDQLVRMGSLIDPTVTLSGTKAAIDVADPLQAGTAYAELAPTLARLSEHARRALVPELDGAGPRVLEVGGGTSPWGVDLCRADADRHVTLIDLPAVVDAARRVVGAAGLADRYEYLPGDVFRVEPSERFDLVVVAGFCRLLGADENRALFHRLAGWCAPGAQIAVIDAVSTEEARVRGLARYELGLLGRTSQGRCWTLDHYARWLTEAGFGSLAVTPTERPEASLVRARRSPVEAA